MWREYSSGYVKNNRSSSLSVRLSAFVAALLLSLLSSMFYNMWKYEVERIELEEGGWHSRIIGAFEQETIESVKNLANVKDAVVVTDKGGEAALDLYFYDRRAVFADSPRIAGMVGARQDKLVYHYGLLAMYLIRDSGDTAPRLVFPLFILITVMASVSLIVIIHNAFAVSMNARIHQFGIFSSIGATPKQIRTCLMQEAAVLCAVPVIMGNLLGIAGSMGILHMVNVVLGNGIAGRHKSVFGYHPLVLALTLPVTVATIWISAWLPAGKLSRLTPLEAIKNTGELQLKRRKRSGLSALLFGVEGELAGNALKAQRKALRTASLSFLFSLLAFSLMQCFFSLSQLSTRETYFERFKDVWDVMVTVRDSEADVFEEAEAVRGLAGAESVIVYRKARAKRIITEKEMSPDMQSFGGFSHASDSYVTAVWGGFLVSAPIVILDDNSFLAYCEEIGVTPRLDGAVVLNRIRDVTNPDFRHPVYMPYIKEPDMGEKAAGILRQWGNEEVTAELPVLSYTQEVPVLREEYATLDHYELVHFLPASLWREIKEEIGGMEEDSYICVRGKENVTLEELNRLQDEIAGLVGGQSVVESENRIQEYADNDRQIWGMKFIFGGFCILLAVIGVGNVFSNTLGFVSQRKREFARYLSIGMTPGELRKMFCIEASIMVGGPVLRSLLFVILAVGYMLRMSYVDVGEFMAEAPLVPVGIFMAAIFGSVALAYFAAWRNVRKISLAEVLRDDTLM